MTSSLDSDVRTVASAVIPPIAVTAVGACWIALPALQYLGAYHRASALMDPESSIGWLDTLDLSPWYVVLLAATLLIAAIRYLFRESRPARETAKGA